MRKPVYHDQQGNEIETPLGPDGIPTHSKIKESIDAHRLPMPKPPGGKKKRQSLMLSY